LLTSGARGARAAGLPSRSRCPRGSTRFFSCDPGSRPGSTNTSRLGSKILGIGDFIRLCQSARHVVLSGTFTSSQLEVATGDGKLRNAEQGPRHKFVERIERAC
jgi:acyl CoA:acetate/3-ketoacid CoA transferase